MVERFKATGLGGNETILKGIIDRECVAKNAEERAGKVRDSLYASDYGACVRKTYFQFFPDKFPQGGFEPRIIRIFQNGDSVHERLSAYLRRDRGLNFMEEIDIPRDELDVHGRCDGLATVNEQFVVIEFKSINRTNVVCPKEEHLGQITWYMMMWDKYRKALRQLLGLGEDEVPPKGFDIEHYKQLTQEERMLVNSQGPIKGEIIYEAKPTQSVHHFPVNLEQDRARKVRLWFEQMKWHIDNKIVPDNRNDKSRFPCQWGKGSSFGRCAYFDVCYGNGNGDGC